jgi:hypothetical protein
MRAQLLIFEQLNLDLTQKSLALADDFAEKEFAISEQM